MGLKYFKKEILKSVKKKKKIIILGRGFSSSFFLNKIDKYQNKTLTIGFNTNEITNHIDFYFTNKKKIPDNLAKKKLVKLKDILNLDQKNLNLYRVGSIEYSIDPLLYYINSVVKKDKVSAELIFIGFDFRSALPDSDYKKRTRKELVQSHIDISSQRDLFFKRTNFYDNIQIVHAGFDFHSNIDPRKNLLNFRYKKEIFKVKIVAEITTNHHGNDKKIIDLITGAKNAGADYVKFQMRNVETFYPQKILNKKYKSPFGNTFRDYRNKLELTDDQINLIIKLCGELKIKPFFSILDIESFKRLKKFKFDIIKLPSTISEDKKFLRYIKNNYQGDIVVSTGMSSHDYLTKCAKLFKKNSKLFLMHCVSSYPTSPLDTNLDVIREIKNLSRKYKNIVPGYSSHDLTNISSAMSIASGARLIEKHIKLGSSKWAHFDETALDVNYEFPSWVKCVRSSERVLGDPIKKIYKSEHHKYRFRKSD